MKEFEERVSLKEFITTNYKNKELPYSRGLYSLLECGPMAGLILTQDLRWGLASVVGYGFLYVIERHLNSD